MKILANKEIKNLFHSLSLVFGVTFLLAEVFLWLSYRHRKTSAKRNVTPKTM